MNKPNYNFQRKIISETLEGLKKGDYLMAACPGSGKTVMTIKIINKLLEDKPRAKVLVLAHAQVIIRQQWAEYFDKYGKNVNKIVLDSDHKVKQLNKFNVTIGIPQTVIHDRSLTKIEYLVIDEAHQWTHSKTVKKIIKRLKPKRILYLTGTPSVALVNKKLKRSSVTVQDLLRYNVVTDPHIELCEADYYYHMKDYVQTLDLRLDTNLSKSRTFKTMDNILDKIMSRLVSTKKLTDRKWTKRQWPRAIKQLGKTMIVAHSQAHAYDIYDYFQKNKVNSLISISIEHRAQGALETIHKFKTDDKHNIMIVVNRGILGFDFDGLVNIIDISGSLNVSRLFQLLCRVIRRDKNNSKKMYLKVCPPGMMAINYFSMSYCVALSDKKYYDSFAGYIHKTKLVVPKSFEDLMVIKDKKVWANVQWEKHASIYTFKDIQAVNSGKISSFGYTTFDKVKARILNKDPVTLWDLESALAVARQCKGRDDFRVKFKGAQQWLKSNNKSHHLDGIFGRYPKWNEAELILALKRSKSRDHFRRTSGGAYHWATKHNLLYIVDRFFKKSNKWSKDKALKIANECHNRAHFRTAHAGAYAYVIHNGLMSELDNIFPSEIRRRPWVISEVLDLAKEFTLMSKFRQAHHGAYKWLKKENKLNKLPFKANIYTHWTKLKALKAAKKCIHKSQFSDLYDGAYHYLQKHHPDSLVGLWS